MNITKGKLSVPQKVVIYGVEGIGKSTFAAQFPNPLFIDTEGSTKHLDVARFDCPTSWQALLDEVKYVIANPSCCQTLAIDTMDWAERLCSEHICGKAGKKGIEDFGYGNGFTFLNEEFGRLLNLLNEVIDKGINVVVTAHAQLVKFEQPDEAGAYDRYEMKLGIKKTEKRTAALIKEWADMVLFANYKTYSVATDDKGKKFKAQGGKRVMYTTHHPCWDAKNRCGLPDECPFDYSVIAEHIPSGVATPAPTPIAVPKPETQPIPQPTSSAASQLNFVEVDEDISDDDGKFIPRAVSDLMTANGVTPDELKAVIAQKGYYPIDTPFSSYDKAFFDFIPTVWEQVYAVILDIRKGQ